MLCMTLKEGEYLMIGDDIRVQFIEDMTSDYMRIGIEAPKSVKILRGKVYERNLNEAAKENRRELILS